MSRFALLLSAVFFIVNSHQVLAEPENYTLDPTHTYLHFGISHLGFSTMYGRFDQSSGRFLIDSVAKTASVKVTIEAASINTGLEKRDDHLRSPDFMNAVEFPVVTYHSTAVTFKGEYPSVIEGNLTLLGVTKPVTLTITAFKCGVNPMNKRAMCGMDAVGSMKRSDFGMTYALPGVGDELKLTIEAEGYKD